MSQISTTLTVKEGSTTKSVKLYSSTSDMQGSSYKEFIVGGSTVYAAATSDTSSDQYKNYGTGLKYLKSGTLYYICTEPYVAPSYSGSLTIPAQTIYNNSTNNAYTTNAIEIWNSGTLSGGLKSGDKIAIPAVSNAFRIVEGTVESSSFSYSSGTIHLCLGYSTSTGSVTNSLASWALTGGGSGNEGVSKYVSTTATTVSLTTSTTILYLVCVNVQLWGRAQMTVNNAITLTIN